MIEEKVDKVIDLFLCAESQNDITKIALQLAELIIHPKYGDTFIKQLSKRADFITASKVNLKALFDARVKSGDRLINACLKRIAAKDSQMMYETQIFLSAAIGANWLRFDVLDDNPLSLLADNMLPKGLSDAIFRAIKNDESITMEGLIHSDIIKHGVSLFGRHEMVNILSVDFDHTFDHSILSQYKEIGTAQTLSLDEVSIIDITSGDTERVYTNTNLTATLLSSIEHVGIYTALNSAKNHEECQLLLNLYQLSPVDCITRIDNPEIQSLLLQSYS